MRTPIRTKTRPPIRPLLLFPLLALTLFLLLALPCLRLFFLLLPILVMSLSFLPVFLSASRSSPTFSLSVSPSASHFGPALILPFFLPATYSGSAFFPSSSRSLSPVSPTFTLRAFSLVVSHNSLVCQQSASQIKRCFSLPRKNNSFLPRENKDDLVSRVRVSKKRL